MSCPCVKKYSSGRLSSWRMTCRTSSSNFWRRTTWSLSIRSPSMVLNLLVCSLTCWDCMLNSACSRLRPVSHTHPTESTSTALLQTGPHSCTHNKKHCSLITWERLKSSMTWRWCLGRRWACPRAIRRWRAAVSARTVRTHPVAATMIRHGRLARMKWARWREGRSCRLRRHLRSLVTRSASLSTESADR